MYSPQRFVFFPTSLKGFFFFNNVFIDLGSFNRTMSQNYTLQWLFVLFAPRYETGSHPSVDWILPRNIKKFFWEVCAHERHFLLFFSTAMGVVVLSYALAIPQQMASHSIAKGSLFVVLILQPWLLLCVHILCGPGRVLSISISTIKEPDQAVRGYEPRRKYTYCLEGGIDLWGKKANNQVSQRWWTLFKAD